MYKTKLCFDFMFLCICLKKQSVFSYLNTVSCYKPVYKVQASDAQQSGKLSGIRKWSAV